MARTTTARRETSGIRPLPQPAPAPKPRAPRRPRQLGVVEQVRVAFRPGNRLALAIGSAFGGFVPLASWWLAHREVDRSAELWGQLPCYLVAGGLVYSALTVWAWARQAVGSGVKAAGFCVLVEGVLLTSTTAWLSALALGYLVAINAIATGVRVSQRPG